MTLPTMDKISQTQKDEETMAWWHYQPWTRSARHRKMKRQWRDDITHHGQDQPDTERWRDNGMMTLPTMDKISQRHRKMKRQWRDDITNHGQDQPKTQKDEETMAWWHYQPWTRSAKDTERWRDNGMMTLPTMDKISQRHRKMKRQWHDDITNHGQDQPDTERWRDNGVMTLPTMDKISQRQIKMKRQWRDDITNHGQDQPKIDNDEETIAWWYYPDFLPPGENVKLACLNLLRIALTILKKH